jgi:hypothetical protein
MWHGCRSRDIRLTSPDLWMESKLTSDTTSWRSAPISFWYRIYAAWFKYVITWTLRHRGLSSLTMNCYDYPGINIKDLLENRASHIQIVAPYVALRFRPTSDVWSVHTHDDTHVVETFSPLRLIIIDFTFGSWSAVFNTFCMYCMHAWRDEASF